MSRPGKWKFFVYRINYWRVKFFRKIRKLLRLSNKPTATSYAGRAVLTQDAFNTEVYNQIQSGEPLMVSRFGSNEILNILEYLGVQYGFKKTMNPRYVSQLNQNAGVFPCGEETAARFAQYMLEVIPEIDYLGAWFRNMEDYILKEYAIQARPVRLKYLEPYMASNPWSAALKGKKVLVIHPFNQTIQSQYKKRALLFENPNVLPEFELYTLKAVQSIGDNHNGFKDWFEALDYMYEEAMKIDFDVAILGCGAYGLPLAARLKQAGKQAIHLGGTVQILFGIKGKRWDTDPLTNPFYNEHWVRPLPEETPEAAKSVEAGCYW